jgi:hypothetical protein
MKCIKFYEEVTVEFLVHYRFLIFVRVTPVRMRIFNDPIQEIVNGKRDWITTSGIGWFPLEEA